MAIARALDMAKTVGRGRDRGQGGVNQKSLKLEYCFKLNTLRVYTTNMWENPDSEKKIVPKMDAAVPAGNLVLHVQCECQWNVNA